MRPHPPIELAEVPQKNVLVCAQSIVPKDESKAAVISCPPLSACSRATLKCVGNAVCFKCGFENMKKEI